MKSFIMIMVILAAAAGQAKSIEIQMKNNGKDGLMSFEPGFVQLQPGDSVTFVPKDPAHNSASLLVPAGANTWTGKIDQKVTVNFTKEGVYIFKCDPHLPMGMVGVVQVGKATNLAAAKAEAEKVSKTFAMNKDRLAKYLAQIK